MTPLALLAGLALAVAGFFLRILALFVFLTLVLFAARVIF